MELILAALLSASLVSHTSPSVSPFPPPPPPPPVENLVLGSAALISPPASSPASTPVPAPVYTPPTPHPQPQQQDPPKESWADKFWKRYTENKRSN